MKISLIYAQNTAGEIGLAGPAPMQWHYPEDLARFKALTAGKPIVMGSHTFDSLPRLLPDRFHIVLTHRKGLLRLGRMDKVQFCDNLSDAVLIATELGHEELFVIGGSHLLESAMYSADNIYRTIVLDVIPQGQTVRVPMPHESSVWDKFNKVAVETISERLTFEHWVRHE